MDKRTASGVAGDLSRYTDFSAAEAMTKAAENPGGGGGMGAGLGMGLGMAMAERMARRGPWGEAPATAASAAARGRAALAPRRGRRGQRPLHRGRAAADGRLGRADPREPCLAAGAGCLDPRRRGGRPRRRCSARCRRRRPSAEAAPLPPARPGQPRSTAFPCPACGSGLRVRAGHHVAPLPALRQRGADPRGARAESRELDFRDAAGEVVAPEALEETRTAQCPSCGARDRVRRRAARPRMPVLRRAASSPTPATPGRSSRRRSCPFWWTRTRRERR